MLKGELQIFTEAHEMSHVGVYQTVAQGLVSDKYNIEYVEGKLYVHPVEIALTVLSAEMIYGDDPPDYKVSDDGLIPPDTSDVLGIDYKCAGSNTSRPGDYEIHIIAVESTDYQVTEYTNGKLTHSTMK